MISHRAGVGDGRRAVGAEEAQAGVEEPSLPNCVDAEGEVHVAGIGEVDLVVVPAVAVMGENIAAAGGGGLERMRAEHPVAEIDDVDVLLDQDVAGEGAIPEPVAQPILVGRCAGAVLFSRCGRVVVCPSDGNLAQCAGLDLLRDGGDGRRVAALEADIDALRGLDALGDLESVFGLANVDAHWLFAVDMLAGRDRGLKMLHVKEGRRGDLDQVDVRRGGELFEGMRAVEEQLAVDGRAAETRR